MFAGPSGIGKTTLAKWVSEEFNIPFVSGSYYDMPGIDQKDHKSILKVDPKEQYEKDFQVLCYRQKIISKQELESNCFVTDRSFIDNMTYFWYKQDTNQPECELENFFEICRELTLRYCDIIIFLNLELETYQDWKMEDDNKRITNRYYQIHISNLMRLSMEIFMNNDQPSPNNTWVYIESDLSLDKRKEHIKEIIEKWQRENHQ